MIVSVFRAALDLDTYPLSNLIHPRCAERAKPGRGKPVLNMHIGFFACFHAIPLERRSSRSFPEGSEGPPLGGARSRRSRPLLASPPH